MTPEFWLERWQRGETGWHQEDFNRHLVEIWPRMVVPPETRVFVPLCGKSLDLLWLAGRGHRVLGVELSRLAVEAFFSENGIAYEIEPAPPGEPPLDRFRAGEIEILCGDFFDLRPSHLEGVGAVYDRASLIALPPELRRRYAEHLESLLPSLVPRMLVTLEYDQGLMAGPPFSVEPEEVEGLFGKTHRVSTLTTLDVLDESPRFRARGLARMAERVYRLDPSPGVLGLDIGTR